MHAGAAPGTEPTDEDIQRKPWKYIGYRGYAEFDEIAVLEEELDNVDARHSTRESADLNNGTLRDDISERTALLELVAKKLRRYNDFLLQHSSLKKLPPAPKRDVKSIKNWHFNHSNAAIAQKEQMYLDKLDLIGVVPQERTPLRRMIDSSLRLRTLPLWRLRKFEASQYDADHVSYYSDKRIHGFASAMIVVIGATMLITPIWFSKPWTRST
ncbi:hypothetical protein QBC34DRAFT_466019 [Podospora aff. communis PSN243]|uniref:DUF6594 domain-containing protein n=1 Tax=Podospora aff. communis PSN243 TaxID=3040156 RepID=A0AAV9GJB8_9PEZI|nr:hypothetical protein QBC34DRAFT_466019 [Podospora aff. communis PSN243]